MVHRKNLVRAAAIAALAYAGMVQAGTDATPPDELTLRPAFLDAAASAPASAPAATETAPASTTPPKPLMAGLSAIGASKPLDTLGITIGGYVEGAYTYSANHAPGDVLNNRVFDTKDKRVVLDQWDFFIDRPVDYGAAAKNHTFDIGAHLELIYGFDSGLVHSDGLYDNGNSPRRTPVGAYYHSRVSPENQFDINQAYVDFALPLGNGLRIRVGKMVTYLGIETINPTSNTFYSHSYLFGYAIPFTNTGIFGEYKISDDWLVDAGVSRGENQSVLDNNGSPDMTGEITYTPQGSDELKKWKFIGNYEVGPEATNDNHDWWTVLDVVVSYAMSDKLSFAANADFGDAPHALATTSGIWYGAAGYASYVINPMFTASARAEWYQDVHGFTLGAPGTINVYEATFGVKVTPVPDNAILSNFSLRPEIRFDYADKRFLDSGTHRFEATVGMDAIFVY